MTRYGYSGLAGRVDRDTKGWEDEDPDALIAIDPRLLEPAHLSAAVERAIRNHWANCGATIKVRAERQSG